MIFINIEELDKLISYISYLFDKINFEWENSANFKAINMKKKKVTDIRDNNELSDIIFDYRNFINEYYQGILIDVNDINFINTVEVRVKAYNSLQDKISRYCDEDKHEFGHVPINKCVNDLLGFRIVFNDSIDLDYVIKYIVNNYPNLLCFDSSKQGYIATHVYFVNNDNKRFRWELQLWNKENYYNNKICHEKYKQDYTKYETETKGSD